MTGIGYFQWIHGGPPAASHSRSPTGTELAEKQVHFHDTRINTVSVSFSENHRAKYRGAPLVENQKGFTLVELLVAILLLTVGIFAVIAMQTTSMNATSIAMRLSVATSLAQEVLEDIASWPPNDPRLTPTGTYDLAPEDASATKATIDGITYEARYTTAAGPTAGVIEVRVTVTGGGRSVAITGYKRIA